MADRAPEPAAGSERELLLGWLAFHRRTRTGSWRPPGRWTVLRPATAFPYGGTW